MHKRNLYVITLGLTPFINAKTSLAENANRPAHMLHQKSNAIIMSLSSGARCRKIFAEGANIYYDGCNDDFDETMWY